MAVGKLFAEQPVRISRISSFRAENFPYSGPYPWLDRDDAPRMIDEKLQLGSITSEEAGQCRFWADNGYVILKNLIDHRTLDAVWAAYEGAISAGKMKLPPEPAGGDDPYPGRYLNPHRKIGDFCRVLKHASLYHWIRLLMDREPRPLQTITSHKGSQQGAHSDSIHMTTYPLGYLTAAWVAFEDIHPDSGPLVYYPGSHKLPYLFSKDVDITESEFKKVGYASYHAKYEPRIQQMIADHELQPHYFLANKGDVLIWHANLIHGGSPRKDVRLSRKALVCHYFVKGSFAYHDLASSRSRQQYVGTCLLRDRHGERSGVPGMLKKWL